MDWENHLEKIQPKKSKKKTKKTVKIEEKLLLVTKKPQKSEKANFCSNTVFSLYFKTRAQKFRFFALIPVSA